MAFSKSIIYKGITIPNAYAKIVSYHVKEKSKNGDIKNFFVNAKLVIYTNSTKEYDLMEVEEHLKDFESANLSFTAIYNYLKSRLSPVNENGEPLMDWSLWGSV